MMTKRSNHIPTLTSTETPTSIHGVVRTFLNQNTCGAATLQVIMIQYAHAYGPIARFAKHELLVAGCRCTRR